MLGKIVSLLSLMILSLLPSVKTLAEPQATILIYHHVSEKTPPSTSISPTQFKEHLAYLQTHHSVMPLAQIIKHIQSGNPLPENAVAITFDDGFRNIMENAHPLLQEYSFPYTIFVNPAEVGSGRSHLNWQELKQLSTENVLIANHYWDHRHLLADVGKDNWLEKTKQNILKAEHAIKTHIGSSPGYLAYPFGEYNRDIQDILTELDLVGFAQHSGAVAAHSDFTALPRFPAAGIYSNLRTLKVKLNSLAMPVIASSIDNPVFYQPPAMSFSLKIDSTDFHQHLFACYFKGERTNTSWQGNEVTVSSELVIKPGRSRTNCTAPSKRNPGRFYWYSQPFFVATEAGVWLD